jgi:hypothetical protein
MQETFCWEDVKPLAEQFGWRVVSGKNVPHMTQRQYSGNLGHLRKMAEQILLMGNKCMRKELEWAPDNFATEQAIMG